MKHKIFEISDKDDRYSTPSRFRKILLHTMESIDSFLTTFKGSARPGVVVGGGYIINLKKRYEACFILYKRLLFSGHRQSAKMKLKAILDCILSKEKQDKVHNRSLSTQLGSVGKENTFQPVQNHL